MKRSHKSAAVAAVLASLFALTACGGDGAGKLELPDVEAQVWTMPSVEKVLRDEDYSQYYTDAPALAYEGARNEYESAQIIFTPEADVAWYDLKVSDLTSASGDKIFASDMEVYNQWYTQLKILTASGSGRPLGYYPDALVPFRYAKQAGENCVKGVQEGKPRNQGIWIRIRPRKDTPAGLYRGVFTLTLNDTDIEIPVTYRVYDFTLTDANHVKSSFNIFQEYIAGGQLSNTNETYLQLVEEMLEYRLSAMTPAFDNASDEDWVEIVKKCAADERCSAYNVPDVRHIRLLVENSTPECNLLEKAYMYIMDEPQNGGEAMVERAVALNKSTIDGLIALAASYSVSELRAHGLTKSDIEGVEVLITATGTVDTVEGLRTYCPLVSDYNTPALREMYARYREEAYRGANNELADKDYGTTWFYYCVNPREPYANINIDMDTVAARAVSWMQYAYDVEGQLYWGMASYRDVDTLFDYTNGWKSVDVYENPLVYPAANGDGYLFYPGMKYGADEFFPSIRLEVLRDGFEDYEYLYMLEEAMNTYSARYGVPSFDFNAFMQSIYDTVFTGAVANSDFTRILEAKKSAAAMIELLSGPSHAMVDVGKVDVATGSVPFTVYAKAGTKLQMDGKTYDGAPSGEGVKFEGAVELKAGANYLDIALVNGSQRSEYRQFLSAKVVGATLFNDGADVQKWTASERLTADETGSKAHITLSHNTDTAYVTEGSGSMKAVIGARQWSGTERIDYRPYLSLGISEITGGDKLSDIDFVEFSVYNAGKPFTLSVELSATDGSRTRTRLLRSVELETGWNTIRVSGFSSLNWSVGGKDMAPLIDALLLRFPLENEDRTVYLDNVYCAYLAV